MDWVSLSLSLSLCNCKSLSLSLSLSPSLSLSLSVCLSVFLSLSLTHGEEAGGIMLELEVLVREVAAIDGGAAGTVVVGEVATLNHELRDNLCVCVYVCMCVYM